MSVTQLLERAFSRLARETKSINEIGVGGWLRYVFARRGRRVQITVKNVVLTVRKGTPDLKIALSCLGGEFNLVRSLFPADFEGLIIDAGGYIGTASIALTKMYPKARILVIEPSSENLEILRENIKPFENIHSLHGALASESAEAVSLADRNTGECGFTIVDAPADTSRLTEIERVRCFSLEELIHTYGQVHLIKLDIEGAEKQLFDKSQPVYAKIPALYVELHDRIVPGCSESFANLNVGRWVIRDEGEKFLTLASR